MFGIKNPHFPKRLLKKFLWKSTILFLLIYTGLLLLFRYVFLEDLGSALPGVDWNHFLSIIFLLFIGASLALFVGLMAFVVFELFLPMGVLFGRLKRFNNIEEDVSEDELSTEEPGEWTELESALAAIRKELQRSKKGMDQNVSLLGTLVDALPEGILAVDRRLRPVFYNETMLSIVQIKGGDLREKNLLEVMRNPEVNKAFERSLSSREKTRVEYLIPSEGRSFQVTVAPIFEGSSQVVRGVVGVFQDVTDLKKLERMRIDFVANVSHELRTPLTSVKGYAQTLMEDLKARRYEQGEKYIEVVNRNVDRLLALVGDLLDLSSIESGIKIGIKKCKTRDVTQTVLDQVSRLQNEKNIQISTIYHAGEFDGDDARAQQVLLNLIQNAIQYIPSNHKIEICWESVENGVQLRVKDNGPGISQEHLSRLFERFYRVDASRNRENGGTGLGLAIVKHIMQRHGGSVRVISQMSVGTEFICYFPNHMIFEREEVGV